MGFQGPRGERTKKTEFNKRIKVLNRDEGNLLRTNTCTINMNEM